ncbi:MAG: nucleotidyltransferase domain-containing protein [Candidatus Omnitrophica bacterium]|nr:nucleotidyltransferase domain-containing protein [Candidatus Omnitrophota bacterium]
MHKTRSSVKEIIGEYKKALEILGVRVERAILYGSFARGRQREDSDIDLVIISRDFQKMDLRERLELLGIASVRIMRPIEARGYTPQEMRVVSPRSFLKEVLEAGVNV